MLAEVRVELFELPDLSFGAPTKVAMPRVLQIDVRDLLKTACRVEAGGEFVGESLVVHKAVSPCRANRLFVQVHGIERATFDPRDFRPDQCGAVLEILRAV